MTNHHRDRANTLRTDGRVAMKEAHHKLRAIGTLFGHPIARAVQDTIDVAEEHLLEAADELDDALRETEARATGSLMLRRALIDGVLDAAARAKRGRREPPEWVADAVEALDVGWLHPADDIRHRHDTDAGGNCRGPWCTFNSDADQEPF